ncbi:MAG TPA: cytochrome C oxidase subunit IV family protein [Woeseiaceae bacterium]|nr:cytochrome C oxidase subunit IV family protein [Woeseiaceae bacterium]
MSERIREKASRRAVHVVFATYAALLTLLGLTMLVAQFKLGWVNVVANLFIATLKSLLIMWVFMHLREMTAFLRLVAAAALVWLGMLVTLGLGDWMTRAVF